MPERPENHLSNADPSAVIGCLRPVLQQRIMSALREVEGLKLLEGINIHRGSIVNGEHWVGDFLLDELDALFWYCEVDRRPGSFDLVFLQSLASKVRVVRDPFDFQVALDKFKAHERLRQNGVPVPETALFDLGIPERVGKALEDWGAAVLKPRFGGWGKGVTFIRDAAQLRDILGYVISTVGQAPDQAFFLERFYPNDPNRWISVTLLNGQVVYGYRKVGAKFQDFGDGAQKVLDADEKGGGVVLAWPDKEEENMAKDAWKALGRPGFIGFDIIHTSQGPLIVDENTSPGNYLDLYEEAGLDAGRLWANWIVQDAMGK